VFEWPNGKKLEGTWQQGIQHGPGLLFNQQGQSKKVEYFKGNLIGEKRKQEKVGPWHS
jgi:hypothetical protein